MLFHTQEHFTRNRQRDPSVKLKVLLHVSCKIKVKFIIIFVVVKREGALDLSYYFDILW